MPILTYNGPHAGVHVAALGVDVERGGEIEVNDQALAEQLLRQDFTGADLETTVKAIKARVGDDPELARLELATEQTRDHPRPSLVEHLEAIIDPDDELDPELVTDPDTEV